MNPLNITAIKTPKGFYLSTEPSKEYSESELRFLKINGNLPEKTFHSQWVYVPELPTEIKRPLRQPATNYRYELIDKSMESTKLKDPILPGEVEEIIDGNKCWKEGYAHLRSLYELKRDPQPDIWVDVEFHLSIIELEVYIDGGFSYKTDTLRGSETAITEKNAQHQLIDRIVFPNLVLPSKRCRLSPERSYRIIRAHVKDNINPKYAEITSDYNFCFTVKKKIPLAEPTEFEVDINNPIFLTRKGARKRKPKYETRYRKSRSVEIFEMTADNYKDYTQIKGFEGKNHNDLNRKIDKYLKNLMEYINEPLIDCPHCDGHGVILDKTRAPEINDD